MSCDAHSREQMEFSLVCSFLPALSAIIVVIWIVRTFWISSSMFTSTLKFWNSEVYIQVPASFHKCTVCSLKLYDHVFITILTFSMGVNGLWEIKTVVESLEFLFKFCNLSCLPFFLDWKTGILILP